MECYAERKIMGHTCNSIFALFSLITRVDMIQDLSDSAREEGSCSLIRPVLHLYTVYQFDGVRDRFCVLRLQPRQPASTAIAIFCKIVPSSVSEVFVRKRARAALKVFQYTI